MSTTPRHLAIWLVAVALGCARTSDKGDLGSPDNDAGDRDDGTGEGTGSDQLDAWLDTVGCAHQDPPVRFSGDLLYLYTLAPEGGEFEDDVPAGVVVHTQGTVDWEAGHLEGVVEYLPDYPKLSTEDTLDFELRSNGDYTASSSSVTVNRNGQEDLVEAEVRVEGCERWTTSLDEGSGTLTEVYSIIVDPEQVEWEATSGPEDGSAVEFQVWGVSTGDWRVEESFVADDPWTTVSPDREGHCNHEADGTSMCVNTTWWDDGGREESVLSTSLEGHNTSVWNQYWESDNLDADSWGTTYRAYEGSGWMEWVFTIQTEADPVEVSCSGDWDELGEGLWTCDDGSSGDFSDGT